MSKQVFYSSIQQELDRLDEAQVNKRHETVIEGFTDHPSPRAVIGEQEYRIFNSNDYMGFRHHPSLKKAEHEASEKYGTGPGAVRFISGSLKVHRDLEQALAKFHGREEGIIFSSAFAANLAVLFSLITGQSRDSVVNNDTLVVSDELNHRSIIDGIRVANHPKEKRKIFKHLDMTSLAEVLEAGKTTNKRALVVTDGVFSMLGEYQDLGEMRKVIDEYDAQYEQGVLLVVDDAHGVGAFGETGRGTEEVSGGQADVLIGTMGKAFGADGGYVVADKIVIDYLREAAATYIYSNNIAPGTAGAALAAVELLSGAEGKGLLERSRANTKLFKEGLVKVGYEFAADSVHPIQPILIGDAKAAKALSKVLYEAGILVTTISYPVVPAGRDEIRVQISAAHTTEDVEYLVEKCKGAK
ncbi:MAG: aminotransferase class I/II-fold pyridoxal phosphate-dependent enzyme [Candidatus Pacebacteria bacterium]|jgi:glycine C-acetyltransferase|nr:aminotransferase class I/II-fold pyridoxal phosphate-dependent enzyme [Candidatus Paceibacterota bacterium]MBT3512046.1 aminotransferase class I/II-fold pyridoxal phosphate-dependent enzyme [Candidatus Paceibacterota bacterium]MBT4004476.1 aminotransferase class I/II-fold pyridoxal phosphate-dependent enzyme [Candidatus Paceibacterota bacterium]MBT4359077.1 aminotransferase class I/II-fold pyridoxal phosphate-dependent enzyme [Candidatus Paceibacterota bacterium]MBT4681372.1 aminotransferase